MSVAWVQGNKVNAGSNVSSQAISFGSNVTSGDLVIVATSTYTGGSHTLSVTDNQSNTYSHVSGFGVQPWGTVNEMYDCWYTIVGSTGSLTITVTPSSSAQITAFIHEYSGIASSGTVDGTPATAHGSSNVATYTGPGVATSTATDLVFTLMAFSNSSAITSPSLAGGNPSSGWTVRETDLDNNSSNALLSGDAFPTSTGTMDGKWSWTTAVQPWAATICFAGSGGGTTDVNVSDSGSGSESTTINVMTTDSGTGVETLLLNLLPTDSGSGVDLVALIGLLTTDSGTGTDTEVMGPSVGDSGLGSDSVGLSVTLNPTDSGTGFDNISLIGLLITDSGTGADSVSVVQAVFITITDSGTGSDSVTLNAILGTLTDSGLGSDAVTLSASLPISDTGSGADVLSLLLSLADSGEGTDALPPLLILLTDQGIGVETTSLLATLALVDSGLAGELMTATGQQFFTLFDSGTGVDAILWAGPAPINVRANAGIRVSQEQNTGVRPTSQAITGTRRTS